MTTTKGVPLTKEEVLTLVNLVETKPVIFDKGTNSTNNKLKEDAWEEITNIFNSMVASGPRRKEQLRLKWENLKKKARLRNAKIRMSYLKTGGGKPDYIPPDEALEKVAAILGPTCNGYTVQFGGDASDKVEEIKPNNDDGVVVVPLSVMELGGGSGAGSISVGGTGSDGIMEMGGSGSVMGSCITPKTKKYFLQNTSLSRQKRSKAASEEVETRIARNKAVAEYFIAKKKKLDLEIELLLAKKNTDEFLIQTRLLPHFLACIKLYHTLHSKLRLERFN